MEESIPGHRGPVDVADGWGPPTPSEPGPTSLAAATAAIITARWSTGTTSNAWVPPIPTPARHHATGDGAAWEPPAPEREPRDWEPADPQPRRSPYEPAWDESRLFQAPAFEPLADRPIGTRGHAAALHNGHGAATAEPSFAPLPPREAEAPRAPDPEPAPVAQPRPPIVPTQRAAAALFDEVLTPPADGNVGSVIADLAFPEPFVPEPYESYDPFHPRGREPEASTDIASGDPDAAAAEPALPQRVPAEPDVPEVVLPLNDPLRDPATASLTEPGELSRIASALRRDSDGPPDERSDGFDLDAVIEAVRSVRAVRDARLRYRAGTGHTLRIEFEDGVDEGSATREVATLLRETMGLAAQPHEVFLGSDEATLERPSPSRRRAGIIASASVPGPGVMPVDGRSATAPQVDQDPSAAGRPGPRAFPAGDRARGLARVVLDHVQVTTLGHDATVEVQLSVSQGGAIRAHAVGTGHGPNVDAYLLRLAASAAGNAVDQVLAGDPSAPPRGRCYVEHVAVVPFAGCEVAVVVLLLMCGSSAQRLAGSAMVTGDPRQAVVRATLSALNRRLESLL